MDYREFDPNRSSAPSLHEIWNTTPVLRLVFPIMLLAFLKFTLVPQPVSLWFLIPDILLDILFLGALAVAGTKIAYSHEIDGTPAPLLETSSPSIRFEQQIWPFSSSSRLTHPSPPSGYESPTRTIVNPSIKQKIILADTWLIVGIMGVAEAYHYIQPMVNIKLVSFSWPLIFGTLLLLGAAFMIFYSIIRALLGFDIIAGVLIPYGVFGCSTGKFRTRTDRILLSIVPSFLTTIVFTALLFADSPFIQTAGYWGLPATIVGFGICFYKAVLALRAPPGQLEYKYREWGSPSFIYERTASNESLLFGLEQRVLDVTETLKVSEETVNKFTK